MRDQHGCQQCKARRRKCAGQLPVCSWCIKKRLQCNYARRVLWQGDAIRNGTSFGRAGTQKSPSNSQDHYMIPTSTLNIHLINYSSNDFEDEDDGPEKNLDNESVFSMSFDICSSPASTTSSPAWFSLNSRPSIGPLGDSMLQYYKEIVCAKRVLVDGLDNQFRQLVIPISLSSEMLSHTVAAFAVHDRLNQKPTQQSEEYKQALYYHKCKALSLLRQNCDSDTLQFSTVADRDAILLTISFLCHLDISGGSKGQWAYHLKGGSTLVKAMRAIHQSFAFSDEAQRFAFGFLYTLMDFAVGDTWLSRQDQETTKLLEETRTILQQQEDEDSARIDASIGLSWGLANIIHRANRLHHEIAANSATTPHAEFINEGLALESRLRTLVQVYDGADESHHIFMTAEAYKEATFLFIYHGIYGHSSQSPSIRDTPHLPRLIKLLEKIAVQQSYLLGTYPYPMWPIFIAANFANESQRATILHILTIMKDFRPKSNTIPTQAAIEAVWKMKDLGRGNSLKTITPGRLDWQETLKRLGWTLALN